MQESVATQIPAQSSFTELNAVEQHANLWVKLKWSYNVAFTWVVVELNDIQMDP